MGAIDYEALSEAVRVLGLGTRATLADIKSRYRQLVRRCHPDATGSRKDPEIYRVNEAYRTVMRYVEEYRYSFSEAEFLEQNPEERLRRQFGSDPLWSR